MGNKKHDIVKKHGVLSEQKRLILDTYILDGQMNGTKALMQHYPDASYNSARAMFSVLINSKEAKEYIAKKKQEIRAFSSLDYDDYLSRLQEIIDVEPNTLIALSKEELRDLPPQIGRALQACEYREKEYTNKEGNTTREIVVKITPSNKTKALEALSLACGFNAIDNAQRNGGAVDIKELLAKQPNEEARNELMKALNVVLKAQKNM